MSLQQDCEQGGKLEQLVGYVAAIPSTAMPRMLRRCCAGPGFKGVCSHTTDAYCDAGEVESLLGFVL